MAEAAGLRLGRLEVIPVPAERIFGRSFRRSRFILSLIERILARVWPTLFAYQFVLELSKSCLPSEPQVMSTASEASRSFEIDPHVAAASPTLNVSRDIEVKNEALR